ncbi:AAC(3) family N-acetyltransferase [Fusibacter sp. 3D3]|uniref:AAC(3) family N-acetyltransferase n=1 Tax=Fusibacter sp. 3D3 TaxID=1048380 RepID=UPI000852D442|nr:AAC(3) family N-acetyltransferase [Fusibacter sp. 3D3]GAU80035.1 aminoglycoside N3'-acetyltransferase [Fusibacter sp. 3D3]
MKQGMTVDDIFIAFKESGIKKGDIVFSHSNIGFFGPLQGVNSKNEYCRIIYQTLMDIIGKNGTFILPSFTYSGFNQEIFDKRITKSKMGILSEYVRNLPNALRSEDPNFSVVAVGKDAEYFIAEVDNYSFGAKSFWSKFMEKDGLFCNFNFDSASTFIHFVEKSLNVDYRFDKGFKCKIMKDGKVEDEIFYHYVYDLEITENKTSFEKFHEYVIENGYAKQVKLGKGEVVTISAKQTYDVVKNQIEIDPYFLRVGEVS